LTVRHKAKLSFRDTATNSATSHNNQGRETGFS